MESESQSDVTYLLEDTNVLQRFKKPCFPYRYVLVLLLFFGFLNALATRYMFNIALVAMVNYSTPAVNETSNECSNIPDVNVTVQSGGEFDWDPSVQDILLAAFFYGYVVTQLPGGYLAEQIGGKIVFGLAVFLPSVLSLAVPFVARWNVKLLIALRILMGLTEGPLFPSCYAIIGVWSPPLERSRMFLWSAIGSPVGTVAGQLLTGYLCNLTFLGGWPLPFYLFGVTGTVWFIIWVIVCKSKPQDHDGLSEYERHYILSSLQSSGKKNITRNRPWLKICFSKATLALYVFYLCDGIGFSAFMSGIPIYLHQILKFDISQNGTILALPNIGQAITAALSGLVADWLRARYLSTTLTRKLFSFIAEGSIAGFVFGMGFVDCNRPAAVTFYCCCIVFMGFGGGGATSNVLDIAPAYSGTVYGIANLFGNLGGFLSPMFIGYITNNSTNSQEWSVLFYAMSGCYLFGVIVYVILATGEEQPWAKDPDIEQEIPPIVRSIQETSTVDSTTQQSHTCQRDIPN